MDDEPNRLLLPDCFLHARVILDHCNFFNFDTVADHVLVQLIPGRRNHCNSGDSIVLPLVQTKHELNNGQGLAQPGVIADNTAM